jgi:predicted DNA-binding WGR domain protein
MQTWYLELSEAGSHKFYEVTLEGVSLTIRYGRIGDSGQTSTKTFDTYEKALAEAEKKLKEKRKNGYADSVLGEREKKAVTWEATVPKLKFVGFEEVKSPVTEPITKFGGQPVWISEPKWPICSDNNKPIPFLCQIALDPRIFGDCPNKMAYIFAGDYEGDGGDGGWPTDHGDCAVILQPDNTIWRPRWVARRSKPDSYQNLAIGPTIYYGLEEGQHPWQGGLLEWIPKTEFALDYEFINKKKRQAWSENRQNQYYEQLADNKFGGTPLLWDEDFAPLEFPDNWNLLLQMNASDGANPALPFCHSYGDGGCGWWFLSKDGRSVQYASACH